jgi:uncharacterized protein (DUF4415 family)
MKLDESKLSDFEKNLMQAVLEAKAGEGTTHTPEQIMARRRGRPVQEETKQAVKIRFDADVLEALRNTGKGWQTRLNEQVRSSLRMSGLLAA